MNAAKLYGRVYTPHHLVKTILDYCGYVPCSDILHKHIIDNSCGDGAFLTEIVRRYCTSYEAHTEAYSAKELKQSLETFIHGIEINETECYKCRQNLDSTAEQFGLYNISWDVICADTLTTTKFNGKMDFVVGNPPYVRVHNLTDKAYDIVKRYSFSQGGMTDLFIVFFEIGFQMMSPNGKMCLITPNSWLSSVAGTALRSHLMHSKQLDGVIDLGHYQAFKATTYSLISRFSQNKSERVEYCKFNEKTLTPEFCEEIHLNDMNINGTFFLADSNTLERLRKIRTTPIQQRVRVKNGFATLADSVFIGDWEFSGLMIDVIKSSTGKWHKCIFPYTNSTPIPLEEIRDSFPDVYMHFVKNRQALTKDDSNQSPAAEVQQCLFDKSPMTTPNATWHLFGRTQAINDVQKNKIAINSVIKNKDSIKLAFVPKGKGVYGGLYILSDVDFETIKATITSDDYLSYIAALKNYKSGGYYTCSAKDIELYLNYKLQYHE